MKKLILLLCIMTIGFTMAVYSQDTANDNNTGNEKSVAKDTGRLLLREVLISPFEDPTLWTIKMSADKGYVEKRRLAGAPSEKKPLQLEEQINNYNPVDSYVLGVKAGFYGRDLVSISVKSTEALYLPGIVKLISVWVVGRGKDHMLSALVRGMDGQVMKLPMGKLNFFGWNKMEVAIPGELSQISVADSLNGLHFLGFEIDTVFEQTIGTYYIYFDSLQITSDVIADAILSEQNDDIADGW